MLAPKKVKFRKQQKGRMKGAAKGEPSSPLDSSACRPWTAAT